MRLSFRDNLYKKADNPNKYPWNSGPNSKDPDRGSPEESTSSQTIVNIKMDTERQKLNQNDKQHINWETLNQLGEDAVPLMNIKNLQQKEI